jgi:type I restriction enzyme, S subunit
VTVNQGVPSSWELTTIDEVCEFHAGAGFPTQMQGQSGGTYPFYKVKDVSVAWNEKSKTLLDTEHSLSAQQAASIGAKPLPVGALVFAKIGEALRLNRRALVARPALIDNNLMGLSASPQALAKDYLFWYSIITKFDTDARASVVPSIRKSDVGTLKIPLPPLTEQTRIVEKLEELLSDLDAGVAELKAAQKKLTQYRQSLLKAAVEGALTAEWRKHNRTAESGAQLLERILKERRARWQAKQLAKFNEQGKSAPKDWQDKYPEPVKPDTTDLPQLPEGWVWASVEQIASDEQYSLYRSVRKQSEGFRLSRIRRAAGVRSEYSIRAIRWIKHQICCLRQSR